MNAPVSTAVAKRSPSTANSVIARMAERFGVDPDKMLTTLKATAFKGDVSNEQMMALLVVAEQHKLNPWTKEIYAFPDKNHGIVPVVGVDGWSRIINEHAQFDGVEFEQTADACTCTIYRKDRSHPIRVTEYLAECKRATGPWQSHPNRMLRHKALIQCARLAFGFGGIYDQDEAERIIEAEPTVVHEVKTGAKDALRAKLIPQKSEPETIPQFSAETAAHALREAGSVKDLQAAWQSVCKDFSDTRRELPLELEPIYKDRLEALTEQEGKKLDV